MDYYEEITILLAIIIGKRINNLNKTIKGNEYFNNQKRKYYQVLEYYKNIILLNYQNLDPYYKEKILTLIITIFIKINNKLNTIKKGLSKIEDLIKSPQFRTHIYDIIKKEGINVESIDFTDIDKMKKQIEYIMNQEQKIQPIIFDEKDILKYTTKNLLKEEHINNFGHMDAIIRSKNEFPKNEYQEIMSGKDILSQGYNMYGGQYQYQSSSVVPTSLSSRGAISPEEAKYFNKYKFIDIEYKKGNVMPEKNQKKYMNISRYLLYDNNISPPNFSDEPTLCISLFMDAGALLKNDFTNFTSKYYPNQIRLILAFKYYFPKGNVRVYFDKFLLDALEKMDGLDEKFILPTKINNKFEYIDFESDKGKLVNTFLSQYISSVKQLDTIKFKSSLHRFLSYYDIAAKSYSENGNIKLSSKGGDFFVYELFGPFLQYFEKDENNKFKVVNKITQYKCHQTDGYIGQHMRYISLNQQNYQYKENIINRAKHLIWRDGHTNCIAYGDSQWIGEFNKLSRENKKELYMIPTSIKYEQVWNDYDVCDNKLIRRSAIAGIVQFTNYTDEKRFIPYNVYCQSIGLPFILNDNDLLILMKERPDQFIWWKNQSVNKYMYGIDEYTLSSLFMIDYYRKKSIYFNHYFLSDTLNKSHFINYFGTVMLDPIFISACFILYYLFKLNMLDKTKTYSKYEFIKKVEYIRQNQSEFQKNLNLSLALSIFPTKWHFNHTIFASDDNREFLEIEERHYINYNILKLLLIYSKLFKNEYNLVELEKEYGNLSENELKNNIIVKTITDEQVDNFYNDKQNLNKLNITCDSSAIASPVEWCTRPYFYKFNKPKQHECPAIDYYSGYYNELPPSAKIGILRLPTDLKRTINDLEVNTFDKKLELSKYQNSDFSKSFINVDDTSSGHIKPEVQDLIMAYKEPGEICLTDKEGCKTFIIATEAAEIHGNYKSGETQSTIWVSLIWKALLLSGYPIPYNWSIYRGYGNSIEIEKLSLELSKIKGWSKYAIICLLINHPPMLSEEQKYARSDEIINYINTNNINGMTFDNLLKANNIKKLSQEGGNYYKFQKYKLKYLNLKKKLNI